MFVCGQVHMCAYIWSLEVNIWCYLNCSFPPSFSLPPPPTHLPPPPSFPLLLPLLLLSVSLNLELFKCLDYLARKKSSCLCLPSAGNAGMCHRAYIYMGTGNTNPGKSSCFLSKRFTETSHFQPIVLLFVIYQLQYFYVSSFLNLRLMYLACNFRSESIWIHH